MRVLSKALLAAGVLGLSGCSWLGMGDSEFACNGLPESRCVSPKQAYEESNDNISPYSEREVKDEGWVEKHPSWSVKGEKTKKGDEDKQQPFFTRAHGDQRGQALLPSVGNPVPLRTEAEVIRIWIAPWEDKQGDLNLESLVYSEINKRKWVVGMDYDSYRGATSSHFFKIGKTTKVIKKTKDSLDKYNK